MFRYLIILPDDSTVSPSSIEEKFTHVYRIRDTRHIWVVASDDLTCWDVCVRLGIAAETQDTVPTGIVLKIEEINGYADASLWQNLRAWAALKND